MKKIMLLTMTLWLLIGCTPKTQNIVYNDTDGSSTTAKNINVNQVTLVGAWSKTRTKVTGSKSELKAIFAKRFKDVKRVTDLKIENFAKGGPYYLTAKGKRKGQPLVMAMELIKKEKQLYAAEYNQLYIACTAKYCGACGFVTDTKGEVVNCKCEKDENNPTDYSSCEQQTFIKTLEKDY